MTGEQRPSGGRRITRGALLGAAVTGGWLANDLAVYATSGQPEVFLALVPGSLVALAIGTLLGALAGRFPVVLAVLLAAGLTLLSWPGKAQLALETPAGWLGTHAPTGAVLEYLGGALVAWGLALLLAALARRAAHLPAARTAACLGLGASIATAYFVQDELRPHWRVLAGAALLILILGLPRIPYRKLATAAVLLATALYVSYQCFPGTRPSYWRDDLPPPTARAGKAPSLLLVVLDTVRAESLALYGSERVTSPRLDAWVRERATVFTESRSTSSFTLATHGSLFTGTLPAQHKAARLRPSAEPLDESLPTLAERLRERGYQTAAIVANGTYLHPRFGMDRGFEHFDFRSGALVTPFLPLAQLTGRTAWAGHLSYRDAQAITDTALAWFDRRRAEDPFFLMLNYLDAHTPYIPHPPHHRAFEDTRPASPFGVVQEHAQLNYDRNIHYLDAQLGRLLGELEERGLLEDTLIVITSDHGEAFGEHGFEEHCWTLYDDVVKVPLYLKPAGGRRAERDERPINSADLMWLMLDELGVPHEPPPSMAGLVAEWYRQVPMSENYLAVHETEGYDLDRDLLAWIDDGRKLIVSTNGEVEAFDLAADPDEQHPLELSREEVERALERAAAWWDAHPLAAEQTEEIPAEELERLRALGYVGEEDE